MVTQWSIITVGCLPLEPLSLPLSQLWIQVFKMKVHAQEGAADVTWVSV